MGWFTALAIAWRVGVGAPAAQGQQPNAFRSGVDLLTVDVSVVNQDGRPVSGLTSRDFVVKVEGEVRPVQVVDYVRFGSQGSRTSGRSSEATLPAPPEDVSSGGRVFVLLVDDLSARPGEDRGLLASAEGMLERLDVGDLIGIASTSGLGPLVEPTRDRSAVISALRDRGLVGRRDAVTAPFFLTVQEGLEIDRRLPRETLARVAARECGFVNTGSQCVDMLQGAAKRLVASTTRQAEQQVEAILSTIAALRRAPQPRVLVLISRGLPVGSEWNNVESLKKISVAAAESRTRFYGLTGVGDLTDAAEIAGGCNPPCIDRPAARVLESRYLNSGVQTVAAAAGGTAFSVIGQADRFFTRIVAETSATYRLGVAVPANILSKGIVDVRVSLNIKGLEVRFNPRALSPAAQVEPLSVDDELNLRLIQGGASFGVPLAVGTVRRRDPTTRTLQLAVDLSVSSRAAGPFTVLLAVLDAKGRISTKARKQISQTVLEEDLRLALGLPLGPDSFRLRIAVADGRGNIGSVERDIDPELVQFEDLRVSDLVTTWSDRDGVGHLLGLEAVPARATRIGATLEMYPESSAGVSGIKTRFELLAVGDDVLTGVEGQLSTAGATVIAHADFDLRDLRPGRYVVRVSVARSGRAIGSATRAFVKGQPTRQQGVRSVGQ